MDLDAKRFEEARVRLRQAVEWQRKALAKNPSDPLSRQYMDNHLRGLIRAAEGLGDSEGAAESQRALAKLHGSGPAMEAIDTRLTAIITGDQQHKDEAERLALAQRAYDKALHAAAARLWGEALEANPKLGEDRQAGHRYNAACAAVLAGCGKGQDDRPPAEAAQVKLRRQALGWLNAELATCSKLLESGPPQAGPNVASTLKH
jgi:hypothetical protein